jgi:16S rRNA (cytidine1402-2'-O)-methyltransferase
MPSNSPIKKGPAGDAAMGDLFVVATPIGHREDITLRALKTLATVDLIAAEDTRHTGRLLTHHHIKSRLVSLHEHNERERTPELIAQLRKGQSIALVSNAGTPSISDPGYRLVKGAIACGIRVIPIPGVSAVMTALSAAGLPTDRIVFTGFLSKKKGKRLRQLKDLAQYRGTIVIYESPRRVVELLEEARSVLGERFAAVAREMTKRHEEFIRGDLSHITRELRERAAVKGECTILIAGLKNENTFLTSEIRSEIQQEITAGRRSISDIVKTISKKYTLPKNEIYRMTLDIKQHRQPEKDD